MAQVGPEQPTAVRPAVSVGRVALALIVGALTGAGLVAGLVLVISVFTNGGFALIYAALALVVALPIWFLGLLVVGLPAWGVLRALGLRSRQVAAGVGAVLAGMAAALWTGLLNALARSSTHEWLVAVPFLVAIAMIGAVVGWVMAGLVDGRKGQAR
jgi:hypothetical protein